MDLWVSGRTGRKMGDWLGMKMNEKVENKWGIDKCWVD